MKFITSSTARLQGTVQVPGSKSHSVRAILLAALAEGESRLAQVLDATDTRVAMDVCRALGAEVDVVGGGVDEASLDLRVVSGGAPFARVGEKIFTGNSGITTTFVLPMIGLRGSVEEIEVECGDQMRERPIRPMIEALSRLGMTFVSKNGDGKFPFMASGRLRGGEVTIDAANSQYASALLISLPFAEGSSVVRALNVQERPYIEMTLRMLQELGIRIEHERDGDEDRFIIQGGQKLRSFVREIPGDFSSASALMVAGVLRGDAREGVVLNGLSMSDCQGDKKLVSILRLMGADIEVIQGGLLVKGGRTLRGCEIDCSDTPDLFPVLAVLGTQVEGEMRLVNLEHVKIKETDRVRSMIDGLRAMGAQIDEDATGVIIHKSRLYGASTHGFHDHRTVMALTVAGLLAEGTSTVDTAEDVSKTFPNFIDCMQKIGASITLQTDSMASHIILIGFKNVGKSTVGRELTREIHRRFVDLDEVIVAHHAQVTGEKFSCREIFRRHGAEHFRRAEHEALRSTLAHPESLIIAVGGGAPMAEENRELLRGHQIVHVVAPKSVVFERIMIHGKPAFFPEDVSPFEGFQGLWAERLPIFEDLAEITVDNGGSVHDAVAKLAQQLHTLTV